LTRLLGSFLGTRGFSNGEQGIKSKKVKGSWEHAPPPGRGSLMKDNKGSFSFAFASAHVKNGV